MAGVLRALVAASVLMLLVAGHVGHARDRLTGEVQRVKMIGFTVADVDREASSSRTCCNSRRSPIFAWSAANTARWKVYSMRTCGSVHLKLGEQIVELTQYSLALPTGRPIPVPSYSNDAWFQHMASRRE